jgi:uncharacterized protein (DUF779 family)
MAMLMMFDDADIVLGRGQFRSLDNADSLRAVQRCRVKCRTGRNAAANAK